jgi:hypothetical protein
VRGSAAGRIAATWHRYDPAAVMGWVKAMPAGPGRDDAIMQLAARWDATTAEQDELIASIGDRDKRGQAKVARIHKLIRTDPARARELLQDDDISDHQRRQLESMIQGIGYHF